MESHIDRVAVRMGMDARLTTKVAAATRYWRSQPIAGAVARCHSRTNRFAHRVMAAAGATIPRSVTKQTPHFDATRRDGALRAVCCVAWFAKGIAIRCTSRLTSHPAKSPSRPCGTSSEAP